MKRIFESLILSAGLCLAAGTDLCVAGGDVWNVLSPTLPARLMLENMKEGSAYYIFKQTHEPLFRREDGQNFTSSVLVSWSRKIDYAEFRFCPDTSLTFDGETGFSPEVLYSFLTGNAASYDASAKVVKSGECTRVAFDKSRSGYLYHLSQPENAPSIVKDGIAFGLGAFKVSGISATTIELERKVRKNRGYNRIRLLLYEGAEDPRLSDRTISDFNRLSSFQQPEWMRKEYTGFYNIDLRTVTLAINHPDIRVRRVLYGCLNVRELRRAAVPGRSDFYDIRTVLPMGVPGAKSGVPDQVCAVPAWMRGKKIFFANSGDDNLKEMREYAREFERRTGMELVVKNYKSEEINSILMDADKRNSYNLVVIVSAGFLPEQEEFFRFFVSGDRIIDHVSGEVLSGFDLLKSEENPEKKKRLAEELAGKLREEGLALPLYQTFTRMYYPPGIKNLAVGRGFSEFPDVAALRW